MDKADTKEAVPLVDRVLDLLLKLGPPTGRAGSDARKAIGDVRADLETLIRQDELGPPLDVCFDLIRQAGAKQKGFAELRQNTEAEQPVSLGATLMKNSCINLCLANEARIIADMTFVSRQDVDLIKSTISAGFAAAEEVAADDMDQMTYRTLVETHAAIVTYLVETARPLPRVLNYQFAVPMPSLVMAYKLYQDAGRADELRAENKVVHPAFCLPIGIALSA